MQHLEGTVQQTMDLLQATGLVGVSSADLADVTRATLLGVVLDGSITDLKDLDGQ